MKGKVHISNYAVEYNFFILSNSAQVKSISKIKIMQMNDELCGINATASFFFSFLRVVIIKIIDIGKSYKTTTTKANT